MNAKQTLPLAVTLAPAIAAAPAIIIGGAIGLGIVWLIKSALDSDILTSLEGDPAKSEPETSRKTGEITRKEAETPVFREIPAIPSAIPSASRIAVQPDSVRPVPAVLPTVQPVAKVIPPPPPAAPPLAAKKTIARADMATIFDGGKRSLSRLDAVAALKRLGFGKTAAYSATAPDGRFSAWLVYASDGIIYWEENGQYPEIP